MPQTWIHGSITLFGRVVELLEVKSVRKGFKPKSMGWRARIVIDDVEMVTTTNHATKEDAEAAMSAAVRSLLDEL